MNADKHIKYLVSLVLPFVLAAFVASSSVAQETPDFGKATKFVGVATAALTAKVDLLCQAASALGYDVDMGTSGGIPTVNGMGLWELLDSSLPDGWNFDAVGSFNPTGHVAIWQSAFPWGNDPNTAETWDVSVFIMLVFHEKGHQEFLDYLAAACTTNPAICEARACVQQLFGYWPCDEAYANDESARKMCQGLADIPAGKLRDAIEAQIKASIDRCCDARADCAIANAQCPPPSPMPPDYSECMGCPECEGCTSPCNG